MHGHKKLSWDQPLRNGRKLFDEVGVPRLSMKARLGNGKIGMERAADGD